MNEKIHTGLTIHQVDIVNDALRTAGQAIAAVSFALDEAASNYERYEDNQRRAFHGLANLLEAAQKDIQAVASTVEGAAVAAIQGGVQ